MNSVIMMRRPWEIVRLAVVGSQVHVFMTDAGNSESHIAECADPESAEETMMDFVLIANQKGFVPLG